MMLLFIFKCTCDPRDLPSFPTRRSSELLRGAILSAAPAVAALLRWELEQTVSAGGELPFLLDAYTRTPSQIGEHTSELQSRFDLVCRLLLEKKKNICTRNACSRAKRSRV